MRKIRYFFPAFFVTVFVSLGFIQQSAQATGNVILEATFTNVANDWEKVERWHDTDSGFLPADFPPDGRMNQTGQRLTFFGASQPASGQFLLYYAPGWDTNPKPIPVLLVHGAFENADWAWANPADSPLGCGATSCPNTGMMQFLSGQGRRVFAISFSHGAGDNYYWAEQIHDAIQII